jgi:hypothetical protein
LISKPSPSLANLTNGLLDQLHAHREDDEEEQFRTRKKGKKTKKGTSPTS